jgi:pimeloyl-ACP methyl ester carboxylesterase
MSVADRSGFGPSRTLTLGDGRRLGFAELGAPEGRPVLHFHGSSSSRLERPSSESMLVEADIRFISVDRPGHGLSDFGPRRRLVDWADDVRQLADHLGLDRFWVEGYSAGGPYALACASRLPERVIAGALVSSAAPMGRPDAFSGLPLPNKILAASARWLPSLLGVIRRVMRRRMVDDVSRTVRQMMTGLPEADRAVLHSPDVARAFAEAVQEGLRQGSEGVAFDDVLIHRPWGFDLTTVAPRIDLWQGDADVNVPPAAAEYLCSRIPNTRLRVLPGAGHFFIFERWREIVTVLVDGVGEGGSAGSADRS